MLELVFLSESLNLAALVTLRPVAGAGLPRSARAGDKSSLALVGAVDANSFVSDAFQRVMANPRVRYEPLRGLERADVAALAREVLGAPMPEATVALVHDISGGNMFWVRQLVQLAAAQGVEAFAEYCARRSRHPLGALVSHLFEQLDDAPQTAAKYASVVGRYFDVDTLLHVLGAAEGDGMEAAGLRAALEVLELRSFVRAVDASTYQFQHPSIQETLYRQWLPRKAAAVHNAVAEHIEAAQRDRSEDRRREMYPLLSHHYELSACHPELAFRYSVKAADYFISTQAYADGLRYAVKAAGMVDSGSYSAADCRVLLDVVLTALDDLRSSARLPLGRLLPPEERAAAPHRGVGGRLGGGGPRGAALHQRVRVGRALPRPGRAAQRVW